MMTSNPRTSGIGAGSIDALRVELLKMNSQQLQAFAVANQDDAIKLGLAAEADKYKKKHAQEAMALMAGQQQQQPISQQILQSIGQPPQPPMPPQVPQGQAPQGMPPQGMPPQGMPPQQMAQGPMPPQGMAEGGYVLPEDQGIATLPVGGMDFAEGGIVGYADKGYVEGGLTEYINKYAQEYGVDPAVLSQIIKVESEGKVTAKNPKSTAHGAGQLLDEMWKKMGGGDRADAKTQVRNAAKLLRSNTDNFKNATGREPSASEAYVTWVLGDSTGRAVLAADPKASVEDVIKKADPELGNKIIKSNASIFKNKSVGDVTQWAEGKTRLPSLTPTGAAQAAPAAAQDQGISALNRANDPAYAAPSGGRTQAQADALFKKQMQDVENFVTGSAPPPVAQGSQEALFSQIPGQSSKAPEYKDTNTYFGSLADKAGIPQEFQRNFSNTLNALGGWTAPVAGAAKVGKAGSAISKGLEPTAEMIQKAEQAAAIANTPRILPPAKAGLDVLDEASAATRAAAENARRMAQLEADRKAATGAGQSIEAATKTANIADKTAKEIALAQDAARLNQAKMTGTAQGLSTMQAVDKVGGIPDYAFAEPLAEPPVGAYTDEATRLAQRYPAPPPAPEQAAGLEDLLPKAEAQQGGVDVNSLLLKMGLNLMAGDSPHFMSNVGKAGIATLGMQQAEEKAKSEAAYREAMGKHYNKPSAEIQTLEWARDPKNMALLRQIAQAKADPKASAQEALAFLKDAGILLKETDPVLYNVLRNKALGGAVPQVQDFEGTRS
jgi:hypothetical protein